MAEPITFTMDLEDHRPNREAEIRYPEWARRVLDFLDERKIRGTVFVVGDVAERHPELIEEVAARGHEVGLHGWRHVHLTRLAPEAFRDHAARGKALLEEITGREVLGFRAPTASLVKSTVWATEILPALGYRYSSSVAPITSPLFGFPEAPRFPFRWPSGLVELPVPVLRAGQWGTGVTGGVFLRVVPWPLISAWLRWSDRGAVPWAYCHPYDFDPDEPFYVLDEAGRWGSVLLWMGRAHMFDRMERLLTGQVGPPLCERVADLRSCPTFVFPPELEKVAATGRLAGSPVGGRPGA